MTSTTVSETLGTRHLYHGTSLAAWESLVRMGALLPRGETLGNWAHTVPSHDSVVYLTNAYAAYFAAAATKQETPGVVLELDVDTMVGELFCCDEDAYALLDLKHEHAGRRIEYVVERAKLQLPVGIDYAQASLRLMGNCGYFGEVALSSVTRAVALDWEANPELAITALEPVIAPQNFMFFGSSYKRLTHWLFDPTVTDSDDILRQPLPRARDGIRALKVGVAGE